MRRMVLSAALLLSVAGSAYAQSPVQRGDYLVNSILNCGGCHSPRGPDAASKPLSGGNPFETPAFKVFTSNLTPDKETGIGNMRPDELIRSWRTGLHWPENRRILPPMPAPHYTALTDEDIRAIHAFLTTVPPVKNRAPASKPAPASSNQANRFRRAAARIASAVLTLSRAALTFRPTARTVAKASRPGTATISTAA